MDGNALTVQGRHSEQKQDQDREGRVSGVIHYFMCVLYATTYVRGLCTPKTTAVTI